MQVHSRVFPTSKDINPDELCRAVLHVYSGRIKLRNVAQLCKVPSRAVRQLLHVIGQVQKDREDNDKAVFVESTEKMEITRLIGEHIGSRKLKHRYTTWELVEGLMKYFTGALTQVAVTARYGVPKRTLTRWSTKALNVMGVKLLKDARAKLCNGEVSRERLKEIFCGLGCSLKQGRPTLLTRDEEALFVAKAELEGAHGFPVTRRELGHRLNNVVCLLNPGSNILDKSKKQYARRVIRRVNEVEPGSKNNKRKSKTGEVKASALSHKRAKQSDPRLG